MSEETEETEETLSSFVGEESVDGVILRSRIEDIIKAWRYLIPDW